MKSVESNVAPLHGVSHRGVTGSDHSGLFRRQWPVIIGVAALAALTGWLATSFQRDLYRASCVVALIPIVQLTNTDMIRSVETLDRRSVIATVAALPGTPQLSSTAFAALGPGSGGHLSDYRITGAVLPNTNLVRIDVLGPNPQVGAMLASRVAEDTATATREMYRIYDLKMVSNAFAPAHPVYPRRDRNVAGGLLIGLVVGVAIALAVDQSRR